MTEWAWLLREPLVIGVGGLLAALALGLVLARSVGGRAKPLILLDGSNIMYWDGGDAEIATVGRVVAHLKSEGFEPVVWFDANVGYKIGDGPVADGELARRLGLARNRVRLAPSRTPADGLILDAATKLGARVVTNDRFRDWEAEFPIVAEPGRRVRGKMRKGRLELDL